MTILENGVGGAKLIRRAAIIGNGFAGAENQCYGLVRALGLSNRHTLYRVTRPKGGINEWLHWLPVPLHKRIDYFRRKIHDPCLQSSAKGHCRYGAELAQQLTASVRNVLLRVGSLRVSFSRRTPKELSERWSYHPPRDTTEAADRVIDALAERGWRLLR